MDEPLAVALKFGFLAVLYLFLVWVVRSSARDLARYSGSAAAEPVEAPGPARRPRPAPERRGGETPRLVVVAAMGHQPGTTFDVADGAMFGRSDGADIRVEDQFASSSHARIYDRGGALYLEDMGSTNGTHLNGRKVQSAEPLAHGRHDSHRRQRIPLRGVAGGASHRRAGRPHRRGPPAVRERGLARRPPAAVRGRGRHGRRQGRRGGLRGGRRGGGARARVRRARRGAARRHRPRRQPAHLRPRRCRRVAPRHGHHAHARQGARRRGEPRPRGRQPRVPHARRRARASSPATTRSSPSWSGAARSRRRPPSTTRSARSSRARSAPSPTSRSTPTRWPAARAMCS